MEDSTATNAFSDQIRAGGIGKFGPWDYVVFAFMLSVSSGIGVFYAWKDRRNQTNREFLMADNELGPFPVAMSLLASFQSAVTVLGIPAQMYAYGTQHWAVVISAILAVILTDRIFLPMFFNVNVTSVNEYLDRRFHSKLLRIIASLSFVLSTVFYLGTVLYGPALALNSVTPLGIETSVITIGIVCTFYTTLGGMKAVVWTDVIQMFVMMAGLLMIIIKGVELVGGIERVWQINSDGGRVQFFNIDHSPYSPIPTVWEVILSFGVIWGADYGISQTQVQRYYSTSSLKNARTALYINLPCLVMMLSLGCFSGVVIYAYYYNCDPMKMEGGVKRLDQLVPYFVMETLSYIPGLAGLFVSCVFSGSLSTLSSGFNALAGVTWEDYLCHLPFPKTGKWEVYVTKSTAAVYGLLAIGFAFLSARIPSILQAAIGLSGAIMGPLLAVFLSGAMFPFVDGWAALSGIIVGQVVCLWLIIGSLSYPRSTMRLETSTECPNSTFNFTIIGNHSIPTIPYSQYVDYEVPSGMLKVYHLSSYLVPVITFLVTVITIFFVTLITMKRKRKEISPELLSPALLSCSSCCLPRSIRNYNEAASTENFKVVNIPGDHAYEMTNDHHITDEKNENFVNGESARNYSTTNL